MPQQLTSTVMVPEICFVSNLSGTYQCARALWTVQFYLWTVQFFGQGLVDSPILSGPAQMILF